MLAHLLLSGAVQQHIRQQGRSGCRDDDVESG